MKKYIPTLIIIASAIFMIISVNIIADMVTELINKHDKIEQKIDAIAENQTVANLPIRKHVGICKASFYCADKRCIGEQKIIRTKSGNIPHPYKTIAVDTSIIPLHSIVYIKNMGYYVAEDTGADIKGNRIDIFVSSYEEAKKLGIKNVDVYILE